MSKILTSRKPVRYTAEATNTTTIEQYKELLVPTISSAIKPDISIKDSKGNKILHIEVLSETLVKTIRKLFFDLLLQLLYIRSVNKAVFEVSGFVLPAGKKNYIVLATVQWNPTQFKFIGESEALSPGSFSQKLLDTIATQETYFGDLTPSHKTKYVSQSLSPQDVVTYLGSEDFYTGEFVKCISLVFLMQDKVYKMPLTLKARERLTYLHSLKKGGTVTKQVLLPQDQTKEFLYTVVWIHPQTSSHLMVCTFHLLSQ